MNADARWSGRERTQWNQAVQHLDWGRSLQRNLTVDQSTTLHVRYNMTADAADIYHRRAAPRDIIVDSILFERTALARFVCPQPLAWYSAVVASCDAASVGLAGEIDQHDFFAARAINITTGKRRLFRRWAEDLQL